MPESELQYSKALGRRVRTGSWREQVVSTYRRILEAIDEGRWGPAAKLANYFVEEAEVCFAIYRQWIPDLRAHMLARGVPTAEVERADRLILDKLRLPDGTDFDRYEQWDNFRAKVEGLVESLHKERAGEAKSRLDEAKETWRRLHDRDVDHSYGLMDEIVTRFGESEIGAMWDRVLMPLFAWRYEKFDISKHEWGEALDNLMLVAIEAMRGHLVGPERTGDVELDEYDDRFVLSFDPCGSGQRTVRGDWIEGTPPRMEPPYNWKVSQEPHPWNHFQTGVCHYCTHCIRLMEEFPIDRFGYPLRVISPPVYPDTNRDPAARQRCQWTMYKDPTAVPEDAYALSGRKKTGKFGSLAVGAPPLPEVVSGLPGAG
ncbi:MAG TPA: hypothetical protein VMF65_14710 [Acidimicrobiales bacterium]|nr:hypothetical protein [Acidimicrobiales bacterium]